LKNSVIPCWLQNFKKSGSSRQFCRMGQTLKAMDVFFCLTYSRKYPKFSITSAKLAFTRMRS
jgi:hypothetical protein